MNNKSVLMTVVMVFLCGSVVYGQATPVLEVSPAELNFSAEEGGANPASEVLSIQRVGGTGPLDWEVAEECGWLIVEPNSGTSMGEVDDVNVIADISGLSAGLYSCELTVSAEGAAGSPQTITVTLFIGSEDMLIVPLEYATIQSAIDAAADGNTVVVLPGRYTGDGNRDIDFLGKAITVRSIDPDNANLVSCTIVDCNGTPDEPHWGFGFSSGEDHNSVLEGLTIINGYSYEGSAIACIQSGPKISKCIITENRRHHYSLGTISCAFSDAIITGCTLVDNKSAYGGAISFYDCNGVVEDCIISGNSALLGGGIVSVDSNTVITNCSISGNSAEYKGGAIFSGGGNVSITNCTLAGNTSLTLKGNALACDEKWGVFSSNVEFNNCILWNGGDEIFNNDESVINIRYSDVFGGYDGEGNIETDPSLVFAGDYHLSADSPCIDAGDPDYTSEPGETDLDGNQRVRGERIDMGAHEYNPGSSALAVSEAAVEFSYIEDYVVPEPQTVQIAGSGAGSVNWRIIEDCEWLEVNPAEGESSGEVNEVVLAVEPNSLTPGFYSCLIRVVDSEAINSPFVIGVSLHVSEALRVPSEYATIDAAVDAAGYFDTVLVADGTYTGEGNTTIYTDDDQITIKSENGPESCIIDCEGSDDWAFYVQYDGVIDGFTIRDCNDSAIHCKNSVIKNCIITGNAGYDGGGIECRYFGGEGLAIISNCTIYGNTSENGGGIHADGEILVKDCVISGNSAKRGSAISCSPSGKATVINCAITDNQAVGTFHPCTSAVYGNGSASSLIDCFFADNSKQPCWDGAATVFDFDGLIRGCIFVGNIDGLWSCDGPITNCIMAGNAGHGIANCDGPISNCTIVGNKWEGLIDCDGTITNCVIWQNGLDEGGLELYDCSVPNYCCIEGWGGGGVGNINTDPCFVEMGHWDTNGTPEEPYDDFWVYGDYHLKSAAGWWDANSEDWALDGVTSRCIDAGNPGCCLGSEPSDANNIRINVGAYGGTAEASKTPYGWALLADLTNDGIVDVSDLAVFVEYWLEGGKCVPGDLGRDLSVDFADFSLLGEDWLLETIWH